MPVAADGAFRVAVFGDMPYHAPNARDRGASTLDAIARERVAFEVNIGDVTGTTCSSAPTVDRLRATNPLTLCLPVGRLLRNVHL